MSYVAPRQPRYSNYGQSIAWHADHHRQLKRAEAAFLKERGENRELGIAGCWGRHGARWSEPENQDLVQHFRDLIPEDGTKKMGFRELCELGWNHGRSASAVETQLRKLIGYKQFWDHFGF